MTPISMTAPHSEGTRPRVEGDREQEIFDATLQVLEEVGYDRLTMDAVAAAARASKGWTKSSPVQTAMAPGVLYVPPAPDVAGTSVPSAVDAPRNAVPPAVDVATSPTGVTPIALIGKSPDNSKFSILNSKLWKWNQKLRQFKI